ncbi:MAG: RimK family alpha-L-glutamate ligase, partial [Chlamydiia bacterium]|nr:RimK family alpha-L-glutamate ligase [Chlamydiia bacterium]
DDHLEFVREETRKYLSRKTAPEMQAKMTRFDLAILVNPEELKPPSNAKALQKFAKAAQEMGMSCEFITKGDMSRLGEFDGLFIRETTSVNHHTYRMARRAHANGLIVIDDPQSILRCCNKVFLHELMEKHKIPVPKTTIIDKEHLDDIALTMTYPCVLKRPDSAFSQGVIKVSSPKDFLERCNEMLEQSDLILAQEYLPTDFDWRVGVLDGEPLYCCRYFMVKNHWQICKATKTGKMREGDSAGVPLDKAPPGLLKLASRAANLIGDGLYGVDIKEINGSFYVMEINDNPSIDAGFEDAVIKDELYRKIIHSLCVRMEEGQEKARKQIPKKHGAPTH